MLVMFQLENYYNIIPLMISVCKTILLVGLYGC